MKKKSLGEKLRERREQLGLGQDYMYTKLNMTQPAYSCIENDKVRFSPKLVRVINLITGFENFDQPDVVGPTNPGRKQTLASRWRWGQPLLYVVVIVVGVVLADPIFQIGEDLYQGSSGEVKEDNNIMALIAVSYLVLYALLVWWTVFRKKW